MLPSLSSLRMSSYVLTSIYNRKKALQHAVFVMAYQTALQRVTAHGVIGVRWKEKRFDVDRPIIEEWRCARLSRSHQKN
jgi:hypothetical protein